jgi:hypothetical protein
MWRLFELQFVETACYDLANYVTRKGAKARRTSRMRSTRSLRLGAFA